MSIIFTVLFTPIASGSECEIDQMTSKKGRKKWQVSKEIFNFGSALARWEWALNVWKAPGHHHFEGKKINWENSHYGIISNRKPLASFPQKEANCYFTSQKHNYRYCRAVCFKDGELCDGWLRLPTGINNESFHVFLSLLSFKFASKHDHLSFGNKYICWLHFT